jgi:hypothetical protein
MRERRMSHLKLEDLARLVDEAPAANEEAHLARCEACRGELDALMDQCLALGSLPDLAPPSDAWPDLRARLQSEGLLRRRPRLSPNLARAAAAAFLFLAGGAMGYTARDLAAPPTPAGGDPVWLATGADPVTATQPPSGAIVAGQDATGDTEAASELFMDALDRYMASTGPSPGDPVARLAALDNIVLTTAEALHEAPTDPIINGYHLSALAQRDAVLRQLAVRAADPVF